MEYLPLTLLDVLLAALLIAVNAAISIALRLGLARSLLWASARMTVQLLLVGYVLQTVFTTVRLDLVLVLAGVMTVLAGLSAAGRSRYRYPGATLDCVIAMWASSWIVLAYAFATIFRGLEPWYHPQYLIPVTGMLLGNALNGISLGLTRLTEDLAAQRDHVESILCLGGSRWEAARGPIRQAVRTGMLPMINAMLIAGIVSLPGMMTGQLLAGTPPLQAIRYQVVIMFLIAAATALGTVAIALLIFLRLFNRRHQFLSARLRVTS